VYGVHTAASRVENSAQVSSMSGLDSLIGATTKNALFCSAKFHNMLRAIILKVVMLDDIMLCVVAPKLLLFLRLCSLFYRTPYFRANITTGRYCLPA
jgi:hypothetical protein